jgi:hypothetical protein
MNKIQGRHFHAIIYRLQNAGLVRSRIDSA